MESELEDASNAMEEAEVRTNERINDARYGKDAYMRKSERSRSPSMDELESDDEGYAAYDNWEAKEKAEQAGDDSSFQQEQLQRELRDQKMPIPMLIDEILAATQPTYKPGRYGPLSDMTCVTRT